MYVRREEKTNNRYMDLTKCKSIKLSRAIWIDNLPHVSLRVAYCASGSAFNTQSYVRTYGYTASDHTDITANFLFFLFLSRQREYMYLPFLPRFLDKCHTFI